MVLDLRPNEEEAAEGLGLGERLLPPAPLAPLLRLEELIVGQWENEWHQFYLGTGCTYVLGSTPRME